MPFATAVEIAAPLLLASAKRTDSLAPAAAVYAAATAAAAAAAKVVACVSDGADARFGAGLDEGESETPSLVCCAGRDTSILSVLRNGCDSIEVPYEHPILRFLTMIEANELRLVCSEFVDAISITPWNEIGTRIRGSIAAWRACFPSAIAANCSLRRPHRLVDADFVHFRGLESLDVSQIPNPRRRRMVLLTSAAFVHLRGLRVLKMRFCGDAVEPAALANLRGIEELDAQGCAEQVVEGVAGALRGVRILNLSGCWNVDDATLAHLQGVSTLNISESMQTALTGAGFVHLRGIRRLKMKGCRQMGAGAFAHLAGIESLSAAACAPLVDATLAHLRGVRYLNISNTRSPELTDAAFAPLRGIEVLKMRGVSARLTEAAFAQLRGIERLEVSRDMHPLMRVIDAGDEDEALRFIADGDSLWSRAAGAACLGAAACSGFVRATRSLLEHGALPSKPKGRNVSLLHYMCGQRAELASEIALLLVDWGADVNEMLPPPKGHSGPGLTPLCYAVATRNDPLAAALRARGARLNSRDQAHLQTYGGSGLLFRGGGAFPDLALRNAFERRDELGPEEDEGFSFENDA